jgi:hypothetical protein
LINTQLTSYVRPNIPIPKYHQEPSFKGTPKTAVKTPQSGRKLRTYHFSEDKPEPLKTEMELLTTALQKYQEIFYELNDAVADLIKKKDLKGFIRK